MSIESEIQNWAGMTCALEQGSVPKAPHYPCSSDELCDACSEYHQEELPDWIEPLQLRGMKMLSEYWHGTFGIEEAEDTLLPKLLNPVEVDLKWTVIDWLLDLGVLTP